jgi:soluble lytic murein transglycosylase
MTAMIRFFPIFAASLLASGLCGAEPPGAGASSDADFLAARTAFEHGEKARLDTIAGKLAGYPLEPYVDYWRLKIRLDAASDDEVRSYFVRWPNTPAADRLRVEWLKSLGKRGQWTTFAAFYPPQTGDDLELTCYAIQMRRQSDGDAALAPAKPLYATGQTTPEACEPLFAALIARGDITPADRIARFRLATEAGNVRLAQFIAVDLPQDDRIPGADLLRAERDPARTLAKGEFRWKQRGGRELALYALERAARTDAAGVRAAWVKQRSRLPDADRLYGNARIAYHAARQLDPRANEWYREAEDVPLTDVQRAWRVRAALRAGSWTDVAAAIDAMPVAQAQEPGWQYWKARALGAAGRAADADAIYSTLAGESHFYGVLSAEALGRQMTAQSTAAVPPAASLAAFGARPDVKRAVKLALLEMRSDSVREWSYIIRGQDDESLLVAAEYARQAGLYDRAINAAERTSARHDYALRYLMPFREQFTAAAREQSVDEALLFGLARQESRFVPDIVSSAGAIGLMQLMPATARWVAKQMGRADFRTAQIADVGVNTQFGAFYFKYWLERLARQPALAAAAYNAGPNRAQAWRNGAPLEGAIWVESIPLNETRDYVKKVLANTMFYAQFLSQPYVPLHARLGTVPPRGAGAEFEMLSASVPAN